MDRLLKQFRAVAEQKSLGAASRLLHISQSALTKNIKKLEEYYKSPLFERHSRGMHLTPYGEILLEKCINIDREYMYAEREIDALRRGRSGQIVIGCGIAFSVLIAPFLELIYARYPDLMITLVSGSVYDLLPHVASGKVDFVLGGIHQTDPSEYGVHVRHIVDIDHGIVVRNSHPLATLDKVEPPHLQGYQWIQFQYSDDQTNQINEFLSDHKLPPAYVILQSNFLRTAYAFLKTGDYVMNLPRPAFSELGDDVTMLSLQVPFLRFAAGAFYLPQSKNLPHVRWVLNFLCQQLGNLPIKSTNT